MSKDHHPQEPIKGTCLRVMFCFSYLYLKLLFFEKGCFNIFLFYIFKVQMTKIYISVSLLQL